MACRRDQRLVNADFWRCERAKRALSGRFRFSELALCGRRRGVLVENTVRAPVKRRSARGLLDLTIFSILNGATIVLSSCSGQASRLGLLDMLMLRKCVRHSWDVEYRICERWDECGKIIAMADGWLLASLGCQSQMAY
ncbi:Uncharacterized protein LW94_844 [Fusarium fujikuroi]|nr:Uncharacterized protein LW94_844 [Fusarium fujikuroi]